MTLFMHQDSYGQYGPNTDDTPILEEFLNGFIDKTNEFNDIVNGDTNKFIKCPICRKDIDVDNVGPIFGSSDKCSICFDNSVEVYFPDCGHATICKSCFETLNNIK